MKNLYPCLIILALVNVKLKSQNFTWMHGSSVSGQPGNYGTLGVPAATNSPGGRHGCAQWVDNSGDLWLMGGEGYDNSPALCWLNDLWKYNRQTSEWTWVRGSNTANATSVYGSMTVPSPLNEPGAREFSISWVDNSGKFWMLGGDGFDASSYGRLADLWRYDPVTNEWTWMKGPNTLNQFGVYGTLGIPASANFPGARFGAAGWVDSAGDLWLFGGRGFAAAGPAGFLNDLWRYNIATNMWTWVSGSNASMQSGSFGTLGVPSTTNIPGGKEFPYTWKDEQDNFYLMGGRGAGYFNDLWRYNPANNTWAWIKGANVSNQMPVYGTQGVSAPANTPGPRMAGASWVDKFGNFWLCGGQGISSTNLSLLNDFFRYNPCTNEWTWMAGSNLPAPVGQYGTVTVPSATTIPGGRFYTIYWTDPQHDLWLFGGEGFDSGSPAVDHMNDLWKFTPPQDVDSLFVLPAPLMCTGQQATLIAYGNANSATTWSVGSIAVGNGTTFISPALIAASSPSVYPFTAAVSCSLRPAANIQVTVIPNPTITISGTNSVCAGAATSFTAAGAAYYNWNNSANGSVSTYTVGTTDFTVSVTGASPEGCSSSATQTIFVHQLPLLEISPSKSTYCRNLATLAQLTVTGASTFTWDNSSQGYSITVPTPSINLTQTVTVSGTDANGCVGTGSIRLIWTICGGLDDLNAAYQKLGLYPNPGSGQINLSPENSEVKGTLYIYSLTGQELRQYKLVEASPTIENGLSGGTYLVILKNESGTHTARLIVE